MKNQKNAKNSEKIIAALDSIDKAALSLQKFAESYNDHIDAAALRGDDKRAKLLIKQKIGVNNLAQQLVELKGNIKLGAYTAHAVYELGKLPGAISGCKGLLSESPNFSKIGDDIKKIFSEMQKPVDEISKLNATLDRALSARTDSDMTSRLDGTDKIEESDEFKTEFKDMSERLRIKTQPAKIFAPVSDTTSLTGNVDFDGIIDDENKRK